MISAGPQRPRRRKAPRFPSGAVRLTLALLALAWLPGCGNPPAQPLDPESWHEVDGKIVRSVEFVGNETLPDETLVDVIYNEASSGWLIRQHREEFYHAEFLRDTLRVQVFHRREGFFETHARGSVAIDKDDQLQLSFTVDEGPWVPLASVDIEGWPAEVPHPDDWETPLPLVIGERWRDANVEAAGLALAESLLVRGHWQVQIERESENEPAGAAVSLFVTPGRKFWLRDIVFENLGDVPLWMVEESVPLQTGDPFVESGVARSRATLSSLRVFRRIELETRVVGVDSVDVTFRFEAGGERSRAVGAGWGTEDKLRLRAYWQDRNFWGGGRQLNMELKWSQITKELKVRFMQPRFPERQTRASIGIRPGKETEDIYELEGWNVDGWLRRPFIGQWGIGLGLILTKYNSIEQKTDDPDFDSSLDRGAEPQLQFLRSTASDPLMPLYGSRVLLMGGYSDTGIMATSANYVRGELDFRLYSQLAERRVLAFRQMFGIAVPRAPTATLPVWRRQYGGGAMDMRSYRRRRLGPVDDKGNGLGGELLTISILEARVYSGGLLGFAVFGEMGQIWRKVADASLDDLRFGVGAGLRLNTPVGPIRLDAGWKIGTWDPRLHAQAYHFSIGETF